MSNCNDYPTPDDAKRFKNNAGSVNEFVTSDSDTFVDQDGGEHITIQGIGTLANSVIDEYRLTNKGDYVVGITLENKFEFITYNGESYFATNPPYTTTSTTPDNDTGNLFVGGYTTLKTVTDTIGNSNLLSNHNFLIASPDDSQPPPDATPRSYPPGFQIFSGVFTNETTGITNLTYVNGHVSFSGGDFYIPRANDKALQLETEFVASVSELKKPRTRGVSYALVGDEYRITVGIDALKDTDGNDTPLGSVKFEQGSVATRHDSASSNDLSLFAPAYVGGGGFDNDGFEKLLRKQIETKLPIYIPSWCEIYLDHTAAIDITDIVGTHEIVIYGDYAGRGRTLNQNRVSTIKWDDDGESLGFTGILATKDICLISKNISWMTDCEDARVTTGDFTGFYGRGTDSSIKYGLVKGFSTFYDASDVGYAYWGGNGYYGNKVVCKAGRYINWVNGTTFHDVSSVGALNVYVHNMLGVSHGVIDKCIFEFMDTGVVNYGNGWSFINNYGEATSNGFARSDFAYSPVIVRHFAHSASDDIFSSSDTTQSGFDRLCQTRVEQTYVSTKEVKFFDRAGTLSDFLSASKSGSFSLLQLFKASGSLVGSVAGLIGDTQYNKMNRKIKIRLWGDTAIGLPPEMTFTKNGAGDYSIHFSSPIRPPHIDISCTSKSAYGPLMGQSEVDYQMIENSGGNWSSFYNANGIRINTKLSGTLSDSVCVFITIHDEV